MPEARAIAHNAIAAAVQTAFLTQNTIPASKKRNAEVVLNPQNGCALTPTLLGAGGHALDPSQTRRPKCHLRMLPQTGRAVPVHTSAGQATGTVGLTPATPPPSASPMAVVALAVVRTKRAGSVLPDAPETVDDWGHHSFIPQLRN